MFPQVSDPAKTTVGVKNLEEYKGFVTWRSKTFTARCQVCFGNLESASSVTKRDGLCFVCRGMVLRGGHAQLRREQPELVGLANLDA